MSFADELGNLTWEAVQTDDTKKKTLTRWSSVEEKLLARIQAHCKSRAASQFDNATVRLVSCLRDYDALERLSMHLDDDMVQNEGEDVEKDRNWWCQVACGVNKQEVVGRKGEVIIHGIKQKLTNMGFQSIRFSWNSCTDRRLWLDIYVTVTWKVSRPRKKARVEPTGNLNLECGLCAMTAPSSILSPCGHMLCNQCAKQQHTCPFCRAAVASAIVAFRP
eukprot:TRINITY_DN80421_c0_g1_i1.p1 TRINITY_DN80421_c0_g1~~TRINITY_DN80421_c0_g1_i1.p1  ORF type:complete len:253 (+),score=30.00 TRINITY_DN80421_c0_g1_i1:102-761(+)